MTRHFVSQVMQLLKAAFLFCAWVSLLETVSGQQLYRPVDGYGNNVANPGWGSTGALFTRDYTYVDYTQVTPPRPSARAVTANIFEQRASISSTRRVNQIYVALGQLVMCDIAEISRGQPDPSWAIPVPNCDPVFDGGCTNNVTLQYSRLNVSSILNGIPQYKNNATAFVDASFLYGSTVDVTNSLRSFNRGLLKMDSKTGLLSTVLSNATRTPIPLSYPSRPIFNSGSYCINRNIGMQAITNLLALEHNRYATELYRLYSFWNDEALFQEARKWVIAIWQRFVFEDFYPATLGRQMSDYTGYNSTMNPTVALFVPLVGAYFLESMAASYFRPLSYDGTPSAFSDATLLKETYYDTSALRKYGLDSVIFGLANSPADELDSLVSGQLSGFFKGVAIDVMSEIVQTARDVGAPSYNDIRIQLGLPGLQSASLISSDLSAAAAISQIYDSNPNLVDPIVGCLVESPKHTGGLVGVTLYKSFSAIFTKLRDADFYYYMNTENARFSPTELLGIKNDTFGALVKRNTLLPWYPTPQYSALPEYYLRFIDSGPSKAPFSAPLLVTSTINIANGIIFNLAIASDLVSLQIEMHLNYTIGYFGIGFGYTMNGTDIHVLSLYGNGTADVIDYYGNGRSLQRDNLRGGEKSLHNFTAISPASTNSLVAYTWRRFFVTDDPTDFQIDPTEPLPVIYAYSTSNCTLAYHGIGRSGVVNIMLQNAAIDSQTTTVDTTNDWPFAMKIFHGILMLIVFHLFIPYAIFMARYKNDKIDWMDYHEKMSNVALSEILIVTVLTLCDQNSVNMNTHGILGVIVSLIMAANAILGTLLKFDVKFVQHKYLLARNSHIFLGALTYLCGVANCFIGINVIYPLVASFSFATTLTAVWMVILAFMFGTAEYFLIKRESFGRLFDTVTGDYMPRIKTPAELKKIKHLPDFEWNDVGARVARGSLWIVIDDVIYDMRRFIALHPSGPHGILEVVGVDASQLFWGIDRETLQNRIYASELRRRGHVIKNQRPGHYESQTCLLEKFGVSRKQLHMHSRLARGRLINYAVGTISKESIKAYDPRRVVPPIFPVIPAGEEVILFNKPSLVTLVEKELVVPSGAINQVYRMRFKFEKENGVVWFMPGENVVLQVVTSDKTVAMRPYTPTRCFFNGSIELCIKIYPAGTVTSKLATMELGAQATLSGPISERRIVNKNDPYGLYGRVGMLLAGSGVTLALQFLDYYLRFGKRNPDGSLQNKITVLLANNSERDLIMRKRLDEIIKDAMGSLRVYYIVRNPSPSWKGYVGLIDRTRVERLMPPPSTAAGARPATVAETPAPQHYDVSANSLCDHINPPIGVTKDQAPALSAPQFPSHGRRAQPSPIRTVVTLDPFEAGSSDPNARPLTPLTAMETPITPASPRSFYGLPGASLGRTQSNGASSTGQPADSNSAVLAPKQSALCNTDQIIVVCGPDGFTEHAVQLLSAIGYPSSEVCIM